MDMQLIERIKTIINKETYMKYNEESDSFSDEIYVDYCDKLSDSTIKESFEHKNPKDYIVDYLYNCFIETTWEYEDDLFKKVSNQLDEDNIKYDQEELSDWIKEHCYWNIPLDHYLDVDVCVDIIVDTGDGNYDFTLNCVYPHYNGREDDIMDNAASLLWLTQQQGYTKTSLNNARKESIYNGSEFLESVDTEINNCSTHINALSFFVKMSLEELIDINSKINELKSTDKFTGNKHTPQKIKDRNYILLDKKTSCGLYDPWNGAGSVLEIKLDKDVKLPIKYIDSILPDGYRGYGVDDIYGMCKSFWAEDAIIGGNFKYKE